MFKVKICGVTRCADLDHIHASGADAIGINLVPTSPRCVSLEQARELSTRAQELGLNVFVVLRNPEGRDIREAVDAVQPYAIQLHGSEMPSIADDCGGLPIIKAISWSGRQTEAESAQQWRTRVPQLVAFLVDAYAPGVGGGTGQTASWHLLTPRPAQLAGLPLLLAGGLTQDNVAAAISQTHCDGVDTASGVESAPGIKDAARVSAFTTSAIAAFARHVSPRPLSP